LNARTAQAMRFAVAVIVCASRLALR